MAIQYYPETKWAAMVELAAQEQSIMSKISWGQYQVLGAGAKVIKAPTIGTVAIQDYTTDTDITILSALVDTDFAITMNQQKVFNFSIDDVTAAQSGANYTEAAFAQAGNALALTADTYALGLVNAGTSGIAGNQGSLATPIAITAANVDTYIYELKEDLDAANVGPNRWLVVPAWFMSKLSLMGLGVQLADVTKDGIWKGGNVLNFAGFNIVQSNQVKVDSTASGYQVLAFAEDAIPLVSCISKVEVLRNPARMGNIARGLYVYGATAKVGKVAVLSCTKGSES